MSEEEAKPQTRRRAVTNKRRRPSPIAATCKVENDGAYDPEAWFLLLSKLSRIFDVPMPGITEAYPPDAGVKP